MYSVNDRAAMSYRRAEEYCYCTHHTIRDIPRCTVCDASLDRLGLQRLGGRERIQNGSREASVALGPKASCRDIKPAANLDQPCRTSCSELTNSTIITGWRESNAHLPLHKAVAQLRQIVDELQVLSAGLSPVGRNEEADKRSDKRRHECRRAPHASLHDNFFAARLF